MLKLSWERCPFCQRQDIYTSTPKHLWEEISVLLLLQPVRCHYCMRRFMRPIFASPPPKVPLRRTVSQKKIQTQGADETNKKAAA
jgi:hypothetical protein